MDKNSVIGLILMALILFGFTFYQSKRAQKFAEQQAIEQARLDSIAFEQQRVADSLAALNPVADSVSAVPVAQVPDATAAAIYKDAALEAASKAEPTTVKLENDKLEVVFTTKGGQPLSARIKDFQTYEKEDLYLFKEGMSDYSVSIYVGEYINTSDFVFEVAELTATTLVMRLPLGAGGYIEQAYTLPEDVDKDNIEAKVENGILTVTMPKETKEEQKKATRAIEIC
jgi:YidC/Oxa1 family membrane protein insertase